MCREGRGKVKTIEVNGETIGVVGLRGLILVESGSGGEGGQHNIPIFIIFFFREVGH